MTTHRQRTYWNNRLRDHWGLHGTGALAYGRYYNRWLYKVRAHVFRRVVQHLQIDLSQSNILDVGYGTGFYIEQWKRLGANNLTALDIADVAISRLQGQFPDVHFYPLDITQDITELGKGTFDIVSAFDVLFHIVDDEHYKSALKNISELLKEGGYFLFSDNFLHGQSKRYLEYWKSRPLQFIEAELERVGFLVMRRAPMFVLMNAPVDTTSSIAEKCWEAVLYPVTRSAWLGFVLGGLLYPIERMLVRLVSESPSTEIMICKKGVLTQPRKGTEGSKERSSTQTPSTDH